MTRMAIVVGDTTTHGGTVVSGYAGATVEGKSVAHVGSDVMCTLHGPTQIVSGRAGWTVDSKAVAAAGDRTSCGATLIAGSQNFVSFETSPGAETLPKTPRPVAATAPLAATPDQTRKLESTFAYDQLRSIAAGSTPNEFVLMMAPIFGFDVPARTYMKLQDSLKDGTLQPPQHLIVTGGPQLADYDNAKRLIRVNAAAADRAVKSPESARVLLAVLLHEFGHHVDNVLRADLAEKGANGRSTLLADSPFEEGTGMAYRLAFFDLENSQDTVFASYTSPGHNGPLRVDYAEVQAALRQQGPVAYAQSKSSDGRYEGFSAGDGQNHEKRPGHSFGHRSIGEALLEVGFEAPDAQPIYFGNWLRDYSQLVDPTIVRPANLPKDLGRHISREALTKIVDILAGGEFHELRSKNPAEYTVTPERLGVYRPREHIDNPKNIKPEPPNPRAVDRDFDDWAGASSELLSIDPATSMKRYIQKSIDFMVSELTKAAKAGKTPEGMRRFGSALHVLEDYFSHSNFCELSLRKLGYRQVLPWTALPPGEHRHPVVTGMFGSTDVIASLAEPIAHKVFSMESWTFEARKPGDRSDGERIMLVLLSEHSDPRYLQAFDRFLALRDKMLSVPGYAHVQRVGWLASAPMRAVLNSYNFVYQQLLLLIGNTVDDVQTLAADPHTTNSTDPSHSQLGKDHDDHPLHTLAAELAKQAVTQVGRAMFSYWTGREDGDPARIAAAFLVHPHDCSWQDRKVADWAKAHAAEIQRAGSATGIEYLHEAHGKRALEQIKRIGRHGTESWDYVSRNYESLFGQANQVGRQ